MNDSDLSAYMGVFLDELNEQQQLLDRSLLELEERGSEPETIQVIFRAAHTLKGSSAAMGFNGLKELMHTVENIFDRLRQDRVMVGSGLMNGLFQCVDYIKRQRNLFLEGIYEEQPVDHLIRLLEQSDEQCPSGPHSTLGEDGQPLYAIRIDLGPDSEMKAVRAMLVMQKLMELGNLVSLPPVLSSPAGPPEDQDDVWKSSLEFVLATSSAPTAIEGTVNEISQLARVQVLAWPAEGQPASIGAAVAESAAASPPALLADAQVEQAEMASVRETVSPSVVSQTQTIRVDVKRLEHLLNLVGELLIDHTRLLEIKKRLNERYGQDGDITTLDDIIHHHSRVVGEMRDGMMKTRMIPIDNLFSRLPRIIRDLARQANKEIALHIEGKETELDRTLIEELSDPLLHILRNAADHGLEFPDEREAVGKPRRGLITIKASHQENAIVITIADDGRGIDPARIMQKAMDKGFITKEEASQMSDKQLISLIFHSGMSTAEQVTELSGRGVGMDIVRAHIEKLNGLIEIDTKLGTGTVFTLKLPLTLAIIRSLLVQSEQRTIAIPLVNVIEIFRLQEQDIQSLHGQEVCTVRGEIVPLVRLTQLLGAKQTVGEAGDPAKRSVVMVGMAEKRVCLMVDRLIANQEIVIKSLDDILGRVPYIAGTTILGDGLVALILDVNSVIQQAGAATLTRFGSREREERIKLAPKRELVTFRLNAIWYAIGIEHVQEMINAPHITKLAEADATVDGVMNLRERLLPVHDLRRMLGIRSETAAVPSKVLILHAGDVRIGIAIDEVAEVLSVYEHEIETESDAQSAVHSLVGSIVKNRNRLIQVLNMEKLMIMLARAGV
ncbi:chemotaxis protein CheW [Paenibacillus sp. HJGM_3]|uniref:chemotaxis protein CheW n=1 Tax=Paenibacillus sp. HJGM_3 TaxID=3379816 RepID=UPI00385C1C1A